jgi:glycosyltransferase involved in cell wall biosynthesis
VTSTVDAAPGAPGPVVAIAIPTYNRQAKLERAILSALHQTHRSVEVTVFDNASPDGTEELCKSFLERDARFHYVRHPRNVGGTANFNAALEQSKAEFFMWLGDDDWIDPDYVERCLGLLQDPTCVVAGGSSTYIATWNGDRRDGEVIETAGASAAERISQYFAQVSNNGLFYGVYRRQVIEGMAIQDTLAGDWFFIAEVLLAGSGRTATQTRIFREMGLSASFASMLSGVGSPSWYRHIPYLIIAKSAFAEIAWKSPRYARWLDPARRFTLAARVATQILRRFGPDGRPLKAWGQAYTNRLAMRVRGLFASSH